ncbi:MAG: phosphoribosyltransferase family protein [bacterium]
MTTPHLKINLCRNLLSSWEHLFSLFLPHTCLVCTAPIERQDGYICPNCWKSLPLYPDRSRQPFRTLRGVLDHLWIGWNYDHNLSRIVHFFKYQQRPELAEALVEHWLKVVSQADELNQFDVLLPVPIHPARKRWRGFNQSELLALSLSRRLNIPMSPDHVIRIINTPSQTKLTREERWRNVAKAFHLHEPQYFLDQRVLIVDDLATSGATLHALGALTRNCGAAAVSAAVITSSAVDEQVSVS